MRMEAHLLVLMEELTNIKRDVAGVSEVRRVGVEQNVLKSSHAFYWRGKPEGCKQIHGVEYYIWISFKKNFEEF